MIKTPRRLNGMVVSVVVFVLFVLVYMYAQSENSIAEHKQKVWEMSLSEKQLAHIEQMQMKFSEAVFGTTFSAKTETGKDYIGLVFGGEVQKNAIIFKQYAGQAGSTIANLDKKFLLSVIAIANPDTRKHEKMSATFVQQRSRVF